MYNKPKSKLSPEKEKLSQDLLEDVYRKLDIKDSPNSIDRIGKSKAVYDFLKNEPPSIDRINKSKAMDDFLKSVKDTTKYRTSEVKSLSPFIGPYKDINKAIPILGETDSIGQGSDIVDRNSLQPYENISDSDKMQQMRRWSKIKDLLDK